jgi:hypothetical protein
VKIEKITWISRSAKEAELLISDGKEKCLAFSQPCHFSVGKIEEPLYALEVTGLMKVVDYNTPEKMVRNQKTSYYSYHCIARVLDFTNSIVVVGRIKIELDCPIPSWAEENALIEFDCVRLDLW